MKILFSANSFEGFGGVEQSFIQWTVPLQSDGHELTLHLGRIHGKYARPLSEKGVRVIHHRLYWNLRGLQVPNLLGIVKLIRFMRSERFDVVVGLQPPSHYFVRLAVLLSMTKPRVISMERLSYINRSEFYVRLDRFFDVFTSSIICVSPSLRNEVIQRAQLPESKVKAIPHGFHLELQKTPHLDLLRRARGRIVIGCVARVTPVKRQRLLLRALKILKDQFHEPFYLVIAGDSSEDLKLQDYVGSLGLTDDVWIMGHYSKVEEIYSTLDLFVLPTACEGFGRSWAEAMAYSIPVITTNIPPMSDYLTHDLNSILVSVDNEYELQAAILRLIKDSVLRTKIGKAGRALVELQFSFDNQIQKYLCEFTGR